MISEESYIASFFLLALTHFEGLKRELAFGLLNVQMPSLPLFPPNVRACRPSGN